MKISETKQNEKRFENSQANVTDNNDNCKPGPNWKDDNEEKCEGKRQRDKSNKYAKKCHHHCHSVQEHPDPLFQTMF